MLEPVSAIQNIYAVATLIYNQIQLVEANKEQCKREAIQPLEWPLWFSIALDIAKGFAFLNKKANSDIYV